VIALVAALAMVASPPQRVATLAPSLTEIVVALGQTRRLVGVSRYDDAPEVAQVPRLGGVMDPSPEAVLAVKPDLLLVNPNPANQESVARLRALGVPVVEVTLETLAQVEEAERVVGRVLGLPKEGEALAQALQARVEGTRRAAAALPKVRTLVVYGWNPLVVAGPHSFADELLEAAGGSNVAEDAKLAYAPYSLEAAAAARPAVILDATFNETVPERLLALPGLCEARRVKPRSLALLRPGPRLGEALSDLDLLLHPRAP
jgi:iron complex transport system substrate-binding protein